MRRTLKLLTYGIALTICLSSARYAAACLCFFGGPSPTLSEQLFEADGAFLARIVAKAEFNLKDENGAEYAQHITTFELIETLKPGLADVSPRMQVTVDYAHDGSPGDLVVLFGTLERDDDETETTDEASEEHTVDLVHERISVPLLVDIERQPVIDWSATESISWAGFEYFKHLPRDEIELDNRLPWERLAYFVEFLEHPDAVVAADAYDELDRAEFADLVPLADQLPHTKLRGWIESTEESVIERRHLYGTLLGLCGTREDAAAMERIVLATLDDDEAESGRYGIEGVIVGYLLLTGEQGLDVITHARLADFAVPHVEVESILMAFQILDYLSPQAIPAVRLRESVYRVLERQECAAAAISSLSGLEDWQSQDRIVALLDTCGYEDEEIRLAIVDYLLNSAGNINNPAQRRLAENARSVLIRLQRGDPQLFEIAGVTSDDF